MAVKEKVVNVIGVRSFKSKDKQTTYFVVDYCDLDKYIPKTDFISVIECQTIQKKLDGKHCVECLGLFELNDYDKLYLSDIELS